MGKISFSVIVIGTMSVLVAGFYSRKEKNPVQKNPENPKTISKTPTFEPVTKPRSSSSPRIVLMKVTAYCPCEKCCGKYADGKTAIGRNAWKTLGVAADPLLLPYRTKLMIPGIGVKGVDDTGGAMRQSTKKGIYHIDVRFHDHNEALQFGVQWLDVKILE